MTHTSIFRPTRPMFGLLASLCSLPAVAALPLEEVLVTAQHREQTLQEVPLSLTVVSGEDLRRWQVDNLDDLTAITPGLTGWQQGLSTPIYALRGISSNSFGIGGEASVAVFVDDAYVGRINSTSARMPDIERVEVLKGPQGTLLGRNAAAGAIHYHTRLPDTEPSLDLQLAAGDYDLRELGITANTPLLDEQLLLRVTGFYREQEGDAKNIVHGNYVGGEEGHGLRLALAWVEQDWRLDLSAANQALDSGGLGYETLDPQLAAAGGVPADPFDDRLATDIDTYDDIENDDANLRFTWHGAEAWSLRSITAWHRNASPNLFDVDGSAVFLTSAGFTARDSETWSQEFRFSGNRGDLDWVAGVAWFSEEIDTRIELGYSDENRLSGVVISPSDFGIPLPDFELCSPLSDAFLGQCQAAVLETAWHEGDYESYGIYGDLSWDASEALSITAGLRYSHDDKDFRYRSPPQESVTATLNALRTAPLNPGGNVLGYSNSDWQDLSESWDDWQPRFAVNYQLSQAHSTYLNLARGYKAGGFEPAASPELSVFEPETVTSADLGVRGSFQQGRFGYDLALFFYDYKDYQVQVIANGLARTVNADGVTGSGFEWELTGQLSESWRLRLHGAYTDSTFDELLTDDGSIEDNRTILTPRHSAGLLLDYTGPAHSWGSLGLGWQSEYQSDIYYTVQNTDLASRGDLQLHHLRLSYFAPADNWQVDLVGRNLFDKDYTIFQQDVGAGPVSRRGMPRHYLVRLSASF